MKAVHQVTDIGFGLASDARPVNRRHFVIRQPTDLSPIGTGRVKSPALMAL
jgi:hypothetical protein